MVSSVGPSSDEVSAGVEEEGVVKAEFVEWGDVDDAGANDPESQ